MINPTVFLLARSSFSAVKFTCNHGLREAGCSGEETDLRETWEKRKFVCYYNVLTLCGPGCENSWSLRFLKLYEFRIEYNLFLNIKYNYKLYLLHHVFILRNFRTHCDKIPTYEMFRTYIDHIKNNVALKIHLETRNYLYHLLLVNSLLDVSKNSFEDYCKYLRNETIDKKRS